MRTIEFAYFFAKPSAPPIMPKILIAAELPKLMKPITENAITMVPPIFSFPGIKIKTAPMISIMAQRTSIAPNVPKFALASHTGAVGRKSSTLPQPDEGLVALLMAAMPQTKLRMPLNAETVNPNVALLGPAKPSAPPTVPRIKPMMKPPKPNMLTSENMIVRMPPAVCFPGVRIRMAPIITIVPQMNAAAIIIATFAAPAVAPKFAAICSWTKSGRPPMMMSMPAINEMMNAGVVFSACAEGFVGCVVTVFLGLLEICMVHII